MEDLISRQEGIKELEELNAISFYELNEHSREAYREIKQMLKELPPAQPKSGQWVKHDTYYDCSRCSCIAPCTETADSIIWKLSDFCPDCGARMQNTGRIIEMLSAQAEPEELDFVQPHKKIGVRLEIGQPERQDGRIFQEIVVEYPSHATYPEYEGKPYFSIKYTENGQGFIGYGTYKPEVLSEYLKEYFMPPIQPERQKGKWVDDGDPLTLICDQCGYRVARYNNTNFCPNCGNDKRGAER